MEWVVGVAYGDIVVAGTRMLASGNLPYSASWAIDEMDGEFTVPEQRTIFRDELYTPGMAAQVAAGPYKPFAFSLNGWLEGDGLRGIHEAWRDLMAKLSQPGPFNVNVEGDSGMPSKTAVCVMLPSTTEKQHMNLWRFKIGMRNISGCWRETSPTTKTGLANNPAVLLGGGPSMDRWPTWIGDVTLNGPMRNPQVWVSSERVWQFNGEIPAGQRMVVKSSLPSAMMGGRDWLMHCWTRPRWGALFMFTGNFRVTATGTTSASTWTLQYNKIVA